MKLPSKRLIVIGGTALLTVGLVMTGPDLSRKTPIGPGVVLAQAQNQPQMSEAAFKNIQVLKGIPVDEFMGTMGLLFFSAVEFRKTLVDLSSATLE